MATRIESKKAASAPRVFTRRDGKRWRLMPDGRRAWSVTTVTGCYPKELLANWFGKVNREGTCSTAGDLYTELQNDGRVAGWCGYDFGTELWKRVERRMFHREDTTAADTGTWAHARCEWIARHSVGEQVGPDPLTTPECIAALPDEKDRNSALWASMAFHDWLDEKRGQGWKVFATESVVSAYRGMGQTPVVGQVDLTLSHEDAIWLLDIKTSKAIYPEHIIQATAYAQGRGGVDKVGILRLPKDGEKCEPELYRVGFDERAAAWRAFEALSVIAYHAHGDPNEIDE